MGEAGRGYRFIIIVITSKRTSAATHRLAHTLRHNPTETEAKLWSYLRSHRLDDIHFRRQHVIGKFIVDFCAPQQKLVIELDGSQHLDHEEQDQERTLYLASKGFRILRFWNNEVSNNLGAVITPIEQVLDEGKHNQ